VFIQAEEPDFTRFYCSGNKFLVRKINPSTGKEFELLEDALDFGFAVEQQFLDKDGNPTVPYEYTCSKNTFGDWWGEDDVSNQQLACMCDADMIYSGRVSGARGWWEAN